MYLKIDKTNANSIVWRLTPTSESVPTVS